MNKILNKDEFLLNKENNLIKYLEINSDAGNYKFRGTTSEISEDLTKLLHIKGSVDYMDIEFKTLAKKEKLVENGTPTRFKKFYLASSSEYEEPVAFVEALLDLLEGLGIDYLVYDSIIR